MFPFDHGHDIVNERELDGLMSVADNFSDVVESKSSLLLVPLHLRELGCSRGWFRAKVT